MDINEIVKRAEQVPELTEQILQLQNDIQALQKNPGYKDLLTVEDLQEITGFKSQTVVRRMMKEIGSAKYRGKVFVLRDDFKNFFSSKRQLSAGEIDNLITDYEINRVKKLANYKSKN